MYQKLIKIGSYLAVSLFSLSILRLLLYIIYNSDFSSLTFEETLLSFLMGMKVDLISVVTFTSPFILLMFLPFSFTQTKGYQKIIGYGWYSVLLIIVYVIVADMVYFQFVHRHLSNEILVIGNDVHIVLDMMKEYFYLLVLFVVYAIGLFFIFRKIINIPFSQKSSSMIREITTLLLVCVVVFFTIRGKLIDKPFGISNAFVVNKIASGNLALNGFYTLYRTITEKKKIPTFYEAKDALTTTKKMLSSNRFRFIDEKYPLMRTNITNDLQTKRLNVVIILLESWSAEFVDSFAHNNFGVTPYFDEIANKGLLFENFYSNGQRSIEAITSVFTGIPVLKGFNYIGDGLELSNLSYLGTLAKENGYSTLAMQSSSRSSYRVDSIAKIAGFDTYYGAEDIPDTGEEDKDKKPKFGTWDGNMFRFLHKQISLQKEPFLAFTFTATTHSPFVSPGAKWEKFPHNTNNNFGFLNTLKYADEQLGEFMQACEKEPWFENTIFIFTADHTKGATKEENNSLLTKNPLENMHIPLVIYAPHIFKPQKIQTIGSHASIIPTLMDLLHWEGDFTALANSLFDTSAEEFAICAQGQIMGLINTKGYIAHSLTNILENTGGEEMEKELLSIYQSASQLLSQNKIYKGKSK